MESKLSYSQYVEALKEHNILSLKCCDCQRIIFPARAICDNCGSMHMEVIRLTGSGIIRTFTTNFVAAESRESEVPYTVVIVELEEGPWIMGNLVGIEPGSASMSIIGQNVIMVGSSVLAGDKYTSGETASPLFRCVAK